MLKPDDRVNNAIRRLDDNKDWEEFYKWLRESRDALERKNTNDINSEDWKHRIQQGRAAQIVLLCELIRKAMEDDGRKPKESKRPIQLETI